MLCCTKKDIYKLEKCMLSDAWIVKNSVDTFFVNMTYFKYFLYLFVAVLKDILSDFHF